MAATVTWETLRDLAAFRAESGRAISFYLDLDPTTAPTAGDAATQINSLLSEGERLAEGKRDELTHEERQALRADLERIRRYVTEEFDRDGSRGLAVFAAGSGTVWRALPLTEPVPDVVKVARDFYLTPLVPLLGRGAGVLVAFVSRERGDVYRLGGGRLHELADLTEEAPRRHDQGGWSQARYQRRVDNAAVEHMRNVADVLDRQVRRSSGLGIVVFLKEERRSEFEELLAQDTRTALVGWGQVEEHASPADLLEAAAPILEEWRTRRETELIERWREETGRNGRATSGWRETLAAASDGRVDVLLFEDGANHDARQCPACGRVELDTDRCPLDGTATERREEGLDLAVHQTLAHGGTVSAVQHHEDLTPVEGIAALLRY